MLTINRTDGAHRGASIDAIDELTTLVLRLAPSELAFVRVPTESNRLRGYHPAGAWGEADGFESRTA